MKICIIYDCLFPYTVGGAERWYRNLAERLAQEGHEVTYLTLRQWPRGKHGEVPGVRVVPVGPRLTLYDTAGRRRIWPPLVFGLGVFWHLLRYDLLRYGRRYDVVHTASFPYFSLLAAGFLQRLGGGYQLVSDWHEVWTRAYWQEYLGRVGGWVGWRVQRLCARSPRQRAFCFSRLHQQRLLDEGFRGKVTILAGEYDGELTFEEPVAAEPVVVFAGRHIPEKRVPALVAAMAVVHARAPSLRCDIYGDGPERASVEAAIRAERLERVVTVRGFVDSAVVDSALRSATCMVLPSRREGYGMVVVEAAARGTPSVVVSEPDNAAVELVEDGVNGFTAKSARPQDLAAAILAIHRAGMPLRKTTADWFTRNAQRLSLVNSLTEVVATYGSTLPKPTN